MIENPTLARRNVAVLVLAQAILGSQITMIFSVGGLAGHYLTDNPCLATLPISLIILGSTTTAPWLSAVMQRYGRRVGFWIGCLGGLVGSLIGVVALNENNFYLFLVGSYFSGVYQSSQGFFRFAATDTAPDAFKPKAISYVLAGGAVSGIIGPQAASLANDLTPISYAGTYAAVMVLNVIGLGLIALLRIPRPPVVSADSPVSRSRLELLRTPRIAVAIICALVSYALMNLVMTATPLAVVGCGFESSTAFNVVMAHVLAMFVPSFFTGHLIARFGAEKIITVGLAILGAAGVVGLSGIELSNFFAALVLLGIGWNFGFIGATSMLTSAHEPHERGRVQGMNDMIVFGGVMLASLASGGLLNCSGGTVEQGWTSVNLAMLPLLMLAGGALIWLTMRPRD